MIHSQTQNYMTWNVPFVFYLIFFVPQDTDWIWLLFNCQWLSSVFGRYAFLLVYDFDFWNTM